VAGLNLQVTEDFEGAHAYAIALGMSAPRFQQGWERTGCPTALINAPRQYYIAAQHLQRK
jgi:hypothetical protein